MEPSDIETLVGVNASWLRRTGDHVKPGVATRMTRSAAVFGLDFAQEEPLNRIVPALLTYLGGTAHLKRVRDLVAPEFFEVDIVLDVRNSENVEDGFIEGESLQALVMLGATVGFSFPSVRDEG